MFWVSSLTNLPLSSPESRLHIQSEQWTFLVFLPIAGTCLYYLLPHSLQEDRIIQFLPQLLAYIGFGLWASVNTKIPFRLGIQTHQLRDGIRLGSLAGVLLGIANTIVIIIAVPALGGDISFLAQTPHAQVPTVVMVPWAIIAIAIGVELNFRGFLLGRLLILSIRTTSQSDSFLNQPTRLPHILAISLSALLFAFDPFMVSTFQHLHWIAVWDGIIWSWIWVRFGNLYATIVAHAIEVMVLYSCVKIALT